MRRLHFALIGLLFAAGCAEQRAPVRIGVKGFAEQTIVGEMIATLLRQAGHEVAPLVACQDTWRCHQALRERRVDVLVEYTGTGLNYIGAPPGAATVERVRALYAPLGFEWRVPLGFDNGYRVLLPGAGEAGSIGELSGRGALRFAVPGEYLRRPRDGLAALVSRYGLQAAPEPVVIESPAARYEAVRAGRADVAIGYATDGAIDELGFVALADPVGFFPPYEAVVVLREGVTAQHPTLGPALDPLAGRIDTATMRRLNARVQIEGREAQTVARRFLVDAGLVEADAVTVETGPEVVLGRPSGAFEALVPRARRAVRAAFPERPVRVVAHRSPKEQLATGGARLSILGAEQLFRWSVRRRRWVRDGRVEALAVLDERRMHVIRRADDAGEALAGRLGIERGTAGRTAKAMLDALGRRGVPRDDPAGLIAAVKGGQLDGALIFAALDEARIAAGLEGGGLALRGLDGWLTAERAVRLPFLRMARLPAGAYGQADAVETVGAQVVLAGAAPGDALTRGGGPAAALPTGGAPIPTAKVQAISDALGISEAPDPALPTAWQRSRSGLPPEPEGWREAVEVLLNGLILLFTGWLGWLLLGGRRARRDGAG